MYYGVFIITYNHLIVNRRNVNFRNILKFYRPDAVILSGAETLRVSAEKRSGVGSRRTPLRMTWGEGVRVTFRGAKSPFREDPRLLEDRGNDQLKCVNHPIENACGKGYKGEDAHQFTVEFPFLGRFQHSLYRISFPEGFDGLQRLAKSGVQDGSDCKIEYGLCIVTDCIMQNQR